MSETTITGELVIEEQLEAVSYGTVRHERTFNELIELFGEGALIPSLIKEIRKLRSLESQLAEAKAALKSEYEKGFREGESKQAILEIRGREKFLAELKVEYKDLAEQAEADNTRLRNALEEVQSKVVSVNKISYPYATLCDIAIITRAALEVKP